MLCVFFTIFALWIASFVAQPVAFTDNLNNVGTAEKPVENSRGRGDIADQFFPFIQGSVGGHDR